MHRKVSRSSPVPWIVIDSLFQQDPSSTLGVATPPFLIDAYSLDGISMLLLRVVRLQGGSAGAPERLLYNCISDVKGRIRMLDPSMILESGIQGISVQFPSIWQSACTLESSNTQPTP
jgi:hypothetical protein